MFGLNSKLKPEKGDGKQLKVHSIFKTFQGEGPYIGRASVFIRLSGCNLACIFCDTDFEEYEILDIEEIVKKVNLLSANNIDLVVITGGEPFRQNLTNLCMLLENLNYIIQIETNATLYRKIPNSVKIVCSPKNVSGKYYLIREDILFHTIAIKFLVSAQLYNYQDIAEVGQTKFAIPVYIQPIDEYENMKNKRNLHLAKELAYKNNAILSIQMHKIIGIA